MDELTNSWLIYAVPFALIYGIYLTQHHRKQRLNRAALQDSIDSAMMDPPSLHPIINHDRCIGCEACVSACPEFPAHTVLGVISGKANLVSPTDCIGHGACKAACPVDAISLVFGTSERGVDIPELKPTFETNVPNIYIAGELGGMGLIRNAIEQGKQAVGHMAKGPRGKSEYDILIIGAGPAGLAATLAAKAAGLNYLTIERSSLGGTVAKFPRGKLVMTAPVELPLYGQMFFQETLKEDIIKFWDNVVAQTGIEIHFGETVTAIEKHDHEFKVCTDVGEHRASQVLLALGRRGTPRTLGVPGEELPKVVYTLIDPSEYEGKKVCVVGGGDSALEAANSIAMLEGTQVSLSYRSGSITRAKRKNREQLQENVRAGRINLLLNSNVKCIQENGVTLETKCERGSSTLDLENDAMIVCVGGILPTNFLRDVGITIETKFGTA